MIRCLLICVLLATCPLSASAKVRDYLKRPEKWFRSAAGRQRLDNVLSYQNQYGCWPKNLDTTDQPYRGERAQLKGTFDNSATVNELRLLALAYRATNDDDYKQAFLEGLACIFDAQYPNGGWPQSPHARGYARHITFNDGTMVGLMTLLREVRDKDDQAGGRRLEVGGWR